MNQFHTFSNTALSLIESFEQEQKPPSDEDKIKVNPIVSKFASWYERVRNAMEFREDEVVLRATIERILKRRLLLGGNGSSTAEPLVKELLWARYIPGDYITQSAINKVKESIDLYLNLRIKVLNEHKISEQLVNEWTYDLMSADIQYILNPKREKEIIANFMFHVLRDDVVITDDRDETKDAQVFMAVRRAYSRDDLAFLRYHMFTQYFGRLNHKNLEYTSKHFLQGLKEIFRQLSYPAKDRIYTYVKRRTAAFFILDDIMHENKGNLKFLLESPEDLDGLIQEACDKRYRGVANKVRTAIIRSVIFIILTKVAFAVVVEGTYENWRYGQWDVPAMIANITIPPTLMIVVSFFLRPPGVQNTEKIHSYIKEILFSKDPQLGEKMTLAVNEKKSTVFNFVFNLLWLISFGLSFGAIIFVLTKLRLNPVSQFVFIFFLAIVSFLTYRISLIANAYKVGERQGFTTFFVDFFFMPVIRVGRQLTQSIAQVNIFLMLFDFLIEAPFKSLFAFFDQWFYFLHAKTEELE